MTVNQLIEENNIPLDITTLEDENITSFEGIDKLTNLKNIYCRHSLVTFNDIKDLNLDTVAIHHELINSKPVLKHYVKNWEVFYITNEAYANMDMKPFLKWLSRKHKLQIISEL